MDKNESKDLVVVKETIFDKIKKIFKKLFSKKEEVEIIEKEEVSIPKEENDFINSVKVDVKTNIDEKNRLTRLQSLLEEEVISEEELPEEDVTALHKMYDEQILELKRLIYQYKENISQLKMAEGN